MMQAAADQTVRFEYRLELGLEVAAEGTHR